MLTTVYVVTSVPSQKEDLEELPEQFRLLVLDVEFFIRSLNDFSEFTDEALNDSISVFKNEVKVSFTINVWSAVFNCVFSTFQPT